MLVERSLPNQVRTVHLLRCEVAQAKAELDARRKAWEEANEERITALKESQQSLSEEEERLREMASTLFQETGNKQPTPGVAVRARSYLEYDGVEALRWAKAHDLFLSLDVRNFEAYAKHSPEQVPCVRVVEDHQVTIATDLGKALGVEAES